MQRARSRPPPPGSDDASPAAKGDPTGIVSQQQGVSTFTTRALYQELDDVEFDPHDPAIAKAFKAIIEEPGAESVAFHLSRADLDPTCEFISVYEDGTLLDTYYPTDLSGGAFWTPEYDGTDFTIVVTRIPKKACSKSSVDGVWIDSTRVRRAYTPPTTEVHEFPVIGSYAPEDFDGQFDVTWRVEAPYSASLKVIVLEAADAQACTTTITIEDTTGTVLATDTAANLENLGETPSFTDRDEVILRATGSCNGPEVAIDFGLVEATYNRLDYQVFTQPIDGIDVVSADTGRIYLHGDVKDNSGQSLPFTSYDRVGLRPPTLQNGTYGLPAQYSLACMDADSMSDYLTNTICQPDTITIASRGDLFGTIEFTGGGRFRFVTDRPITTNNLNVLPGITNTQDDRCYASRVNQVCEPGSGGTIVPTGICQYGLAGRDDHGDYDGDLLSDYVEQCWLGTISPLTPNSNGPDEGRDTDQDGFSDGWEECGSEVYPRDWFEGGAMCRDMLGLTVNNTENDDWSTTFKQVEARSTANWLRGEEALFFATNDSLLIDSMSLEFLEAAQLTPTLSDERVGFWRYSDSNGDSCAANATCSYYQSIVLPDDSVREPTLNESNGPYVSYTPCTPTATTTLHDYCESSLTETRQNRPILARLGPRAYRDSTGACVCTTPDSEPDWRYTLNPCDDWDGIAPGDRATHVTVPLMDGCPSSTCSAEVAASVPDADACSILHFGDIGDAIVGTGATAATTGSPLLRMRIPIFVDSLWNGLGPNRGGYVAVSEGYPVMRLYPPLLLSRSELSLTHTFMHEMGHVLGLAHSAFTPTSGGSVTRTSQNRTNLYASIMNYADGEIARSGSFLTYSAGLRISPGETIVDSEDGLSAIGSEPYLWTFYGSATLPTIAVGPAATGATATDLNPCPTNYSAALSRDGQAGTNIRPVRQLFTPDPNVDEYRWGRCYPDQSAVDLNNNGMLDIDLQSTDFYGDTIDSGWNIDRDCWYGPSTLDPNDAWRARAYGDDCGAPADNVDYEVAVPFALCATPANWMATAADTACEDDSDCETDEECIGGFGILTNRRANSLDVQAYCLPSLSSGGARLDHLRSAHPDWLFQHYPLSGGRHCVSWWNDVSESREYVVVDNEFLRLNEDTDQDDFETIQMPQWNADLCGYSPCESTFGIPVITDDYRSSAVPHVD